jgi:GntR family transcriptional regulator
LYAPREEQKTGGAVRSLAAGLGLITQTEQILRQAIEEGQFASGRLPTEVELAEQLGVSRETVRLATERLQTDGLLIKIRRRGTFLRGRIATPTLKKGAVKTLAALSRESSARRDFRVMRRREGPQTRSQLRTARGLVGS